MNRPRRIGMIVPSSNTCLEPQTYRILGNRDDVTVHFTRVEVTRIALDGKADIQFDHATMLAAARLLSTADVDAIAWNGTAGSWLGMDHDRKMIAEILKETGIPATTSTLAYMDAFTRFGIEQPGLVTPYTQDVNEAIIDVYGAEGIKIATEHHFGLDINEAFARVNPEELLSPSLELAAENSTTMDALIYLCTNLYGAPAVEEVEKKTGIPVLDSVAVTLWRCLEMVGASGINERWGRLLS